MARKTIHDQLVDALVQEGCAPVPNARTGKYTVLTDPREDGKYWYVGVAGALRRGPNVTKSISMQMARRRLLSGEPLRKPKTEPPKNLGNSVKQAGSTDGKSWAKMDNDVLIQTGDHIQLPEAAGGGIGRFDSISMAMSGSTPEFGLRIVDSNGTGHVFVLPAYVEPAEPKALADPSKVLSLPQPIWKQVLKLLWMDQGVDLDSDLDVILDDPTEQFTPEQVAQAAEWLEKLLPRNLEKFCIGEESEQNSLWFGSVSGEIANKLVNELFGQIGG